MKTRVQLVLYMLVFVGVIVILAPFLYGTGGSVSVSRHLVVSAIHRRAQQFISVYGLRLIDGVIVGSAIEKRFQQKESYVQAS